MRLELPEGAEVRTYHYRPQVGSTTKLTYTRHDFKRRGTRPDPKGGWTRVIVTLPDGTEVWGESRCSKRDNFSRKTGRTIALGRALKQLLEMSS